METYLIKCTSFNVSISRIEISPIIHKFIKKISTQANNKETIIITMKANAKQV